ncbi:hypothetical protein KSS87_020728 [Heliosperma pusillum]|nr:hypothetical protein KSS87_020728 [Heliosperma pusillum]
MEEHLNPFAVTHLLQYTLRSLCCQDNSQWVYAVFWRILPRNYPPPKWDTHGGAYDRSRGNRRNWILVWEDGFCNFAASSTAEMNAGGEYPASSASSSANYGNCEGYFQSLQPELFFKMSHEIYNYGEGLIGKVAADHSHKWIYKEPIENQEINFLSAWHNSADAQPRTWEAQFQSGIKTIALIAVREGVVQLGAVNKVVEDLSYVVLLRKKFAYIESIPGVLLPHPSSTAFPRPTDMISPEMWAYQSGIGPIGTMGPASAQLMDPYGYDPAQHQPNMMRMITPSMSSLEALLSKLPSVGPGSAQHGIPGFCGPEAHQYVGSSGGPQKVVAKEELDEEEEQGEQNVVRNNEVMGECSNNSMSSYQQHFGYHHHDLNLATNRNSAGF